MTCGGPCISVVVPTYNRSESLARLLESLGRQTLASEMFEVIVVSDGSTDGTGDLVRRLQRDRLNLFLLETDNRGPASARNAGVRAARGIYLAFTDDDCVANADWLEQFIETFKGTGAVAVQGRTTTDRRARSPLTHEMEVLWKWVNTMPTCNAGYLRSAFDAVGGFDESFKFLNEDADLAWHIAEIGEMVYEPNVTVMHPPRRESFWKRARWNRAYEGEFMLYYKNPEKYREQRCRSPWVYIYWNIFVVRQLALLKSYARYMLSWPSKPNYFAIGIALTLVRSFNMIRFFPVYYRANALSRRRFESAACSSSCSIIGDRK
jgi:glycosyltransferase involved in cell wall biosynthesis